MELVSAKRAVSISEPVVMAIINLTPDSFWEGSRVDKHRVVDVAGHMMGAGARIIDLGAMSTRPGSKEITADEEAERLMPALQSIRSAFPDVFISVDTYRSPVARLAAFEGADMINDISGGVFDPDIMDVVAHHRMAYVIMHTGGRPEVMQQNPHYDDVLKAVEDHFESALHKTCKSGIRSIALDPGFGFGKTIMHNYQLLANLPRFRKFGHPLLAGISRKSMVWKPLSLDPRHSLNATTVLHTIALLNGVSILRVHDVTEAIQAIELVKTYQTYSEVGLHHQT